MYAFAVAAPHTSAASGKRKPGARQRNFTCKREDWPGKSLCGSMGRLARLFVEARNTRSKKNRRSSERRLSEARCGPQWLDHSLRIKPPAWMANRQHT